MAAAAAAATVTVKRGNLDAFLKRHGDQVVGGVFKLRGQNEELLENDLAHEGFGTVEDKYSEKPLSKRQPSCMRAARPPKTVSGRKGKKKKFLSSLVPAAGPPELMVVGGWGKGGNEHEHEPCSRHRN